MPRDLIKETNRLYRRDGLIKKSIQAQTVAAFTALAQQQGISTIGLTTPELNKGDEQAIVDFSNNEDDIEPTLYEKDYDLNHLYEKPQIQLLNDTSNNYETIAKLLKEIETINDSNAIHTATMVDSKKIITETEEKITTANKTITVSNAAIEAANARINAKTPKANINTIIASNKTITVSNAAIEAANARITDFKKIIADEIADINKADDYINKAPTKITNINTEIQRLREEIVSNDQIQKNNQLEQSRVNKKNELIKKNYTPKQLTTKNKNESENEYLSRIGLDNAIIYEGYLFKSRQRVIIEFKNHLKELTRKEKVIEQINNSIESEPDSIEIRQNFNKIFPKIKEDFFKLFGTDKKKLDRLTGDDIMNFINGLSNKSSTSNFFTPKSEVKMSIKVTKGEAYKLLKKKYPPKRKDTKPIFINAIKNAGLIEIINEKLGGISEIETSIEKLYLLVAGVISKNPQYFISFIDGENVINDPKETSDGTITGFGIGNHTIPKQEAFGDIIISTHKLYYSNQLLVKDKKGYAIPGMTLSHVTDNFVRLIMLLLKNETITKHDRDSLKTSEKTLYDHLIHIAKLKHQTDCPSRDNNVDELKNQYKILSGEINSGNNNPQLVKDLKKVLCKLKDYGCITQLQMQNEIKIYKTI